MFDSYFLSLFSIAIVTGILFYLAWELGLISKIYHALSAIIQRYSAMPELARSEVLKVSWRVIQLNWYSVLMLVVLWLVLFKIDVGSDLVFDYADNLSVIGFISKIGSLFSLFFCVILMTLVIWVIPFFLFSANRIQQTQARAIQFYIGTKILSILAILPFYIIANAFLFRYDPSPVPFWQILVFNVGTVCILFIFELKVLNTKFFKNLLDKSSEKLTKLTDKPFAGNRYLVIFTKILLIEIVFIVSTAAAAYWKWLPTQHLVAIFLLISSATVFRLLFFTNESKMNLKEVQQLVADMTGPVNRKNSKFFYISVFTFLVAVTIYYFLIPSLTATNTIYVVLVVFAVIIIYLDFLRNLTSSESMKVRIVGYLGILLFLIAPLTSPKSQFSVPLKPYIAPANGYPDVRDIRAGSMDSLRLLENAINRRISVIDKNDTTLNGNIYVVCAMGGGSRAGYFTVKVLQELERLDSNFWNHTLFYSSISGGSVGVYHYLKSKTSPRQVAPGFLKMLYSQNYNSSGAFGLLLEDAFEAAFGGLIWKILSWFSNGHSNFNYHDRNVRIRQEYDYALQAALSGNSADTNYFYNTFRPGIDISKPDYFQGFFASNADKIPIHLVNTFEISTGRRTVLTPFIARNPGIFSNAILPLQDTVFSADIINQDITYREAVNLSELFPFLSAAATIGDRSDFQFVDGGYFENYGLATAFDVVQELFEERPELKKRLKIILIKSSLQESKLEEKKRQLIAPLVGVINAPFTGHANHFQFEGQKRFGKNLVILEFDSNARETKVSLTRFLTSRHMQIMDTIAEEAVEDKINDITAKIN